MNKSGKSDIRKGGKMFLFKYEVLIFIYFYENEKKTKKEKKNPAKTGKDFFSRVLAKELRVDTNY